MYYGVIFSIIAMFGLYTFHYPNTKYFQIMKSLAFLALLFTSGLRYETAVDFYSYRMKFENIENIFNIFKNDISQFFFKYPSEPGYTLLNSIVRTFTDNVQVLFFLISLFTTYLLFISLSKYCSKQLFFFSLLLYYVLIFFILDMSGVRQCIALNIILYSLQYLIENHNKKFIINALFASMFHFSALIFLFAPLFLKRKISKKILIPILILGLLVFLLRIRWLTSLIDTIALSLPDNIIITRIYSYTTKTAIYAQERPIFIMFFVNLFLYLFLLFAKDHYLKTDTKNTIFFNLFTLFTLATMFLWEIADFGIRLGLYFSIGILYCLPQLISFFNQISKPIIITFVLFYSFVNARQFIMEDRSVIPYNPYQNYLIYELFDLKSTGPDRLTIYLDELNQ
jgi:hypothetical protein